MNIEQTNTEALTLLRVLRAWARTPDEEPDDGDADGVGLALVGGSGALVGVAGALVGVAALLWVAALLGMAGRRVALLRRVAALLRLILRPRTGLRNSLGSGLIRRG